MEIRRFWRQYLVRVYSKFSPGCCYPIDLSRGEQSLFQKEEKMCFANPACSAFSESNSSYLKKKRAVLKGLLDTRWDFRTINGLMKETGLPSDEIRKVIEKEKKQIRKSAVPDKQDNSLYTLRNRPITAREHFAAVWFYLNRYFQ